MNTNFSKWHRSETETEQSRSHRHRIVREDPTVCELFNICFVRVQSATRTIMYSCTHFFFKVLCESHDRYRRLVFLTEPLPLLNTLYLLRELLLRARMNEW